MTLANRDQIFGDDNVQILLGTFHDGKQALMFAVNPLGVQGDGTLIEGANVTASGFIGSAVVGRERSEEHTSELQSRLHLVCRLLLEKKKTTVGCTVEVWLLISVCLATRGSSTTDKMRVVRSIFCQDANSRYYRQTLHCRPTVRTITY